MKTTVFPAEAGRPVTKSRNRPWQLDSEVQVKGIVDQHLAVWRLVLSTNLTQSRHKRSSSIDSHQKHCLRKATVHFKPGWHDNLDIWAHWSWVALTSSLIFRVTPVMTQEDGRTDGWVQGTWWYYPPSHAYRTEHQVCHSWNQGWRS